MTETEALKRQIKIYEAREKQFHALAAKARWDGDIPLALQIESILYSYLPPEDES